MSQDDHDPMVTEREEAGMSIDPASRRGQPAADLAPALAVPVAQISDAVEALTAVDLDELDGPSATALVEVLHGLADRLTAVTVRALPTVESDGRWALDGARSFPVWLAGRLGTSVSAARRDVRLGRALRDELPVTDRAVRAGAVTLEHARVLATTAATSDPRQAALTDPAWACKRDVPAPAGRHGGGRPLPSGGAPVGGRGRPGRRRPRVPRHRGAGVPRRRAHLGGYHLAGFLTEEHGTVLATALASVAGVPAAEDARTAGQRRAQALHDLAGLTVDHGLTGTGAAVRPHLSVHVNLEHLTTPVGATPQAAAWSSSASDPGAAVSASADKRTADRSGHATAGEDRQNPGLAGWGQASVPTLDDGTPLPPALFRRLAGHSEVTRIIFGPKSCVLDVGRAQRTVTGQLRRAVIARDGHCRYPHCHAPPATCEVHHPHHWTGGGETSVENSILQCWHHHDLVHRKGITITLEDGRWVFRRRDGSVLGE